MSTHAPKRQKIVSSAAPLRPELTSRGTSPTPHTPHPTPARLALPTLAVALLAIGFWDLARGGVTLSALALTAAFCVVVPAALWWRGTSAPSAAAHRPPSLAAAIAGLAVLALYVITLAPSTAFWDASEYIAASFGLGIPHPPGNPLFVLVGRAVSLLPIAPTVATRVNLLSALATAASTACWFLVAHRVLAEWVEERWMRLVGAALAAALGATAFTVWNQSVVTEKVYPLTLLVIAVVSWLALRWLDEPEGPRADRLLVLAAYLLGAGYAVQMAAFIPAPGLALAVVMRRPRTLLRWRLLLACAAVLVAGLALPFATQPIRAAYAPAINEGEPTACRQGLALDCTLSRGTWDAFKYNFDRKQYGKPSLAERQAPFSAQLGMWWQYFRWQWWRDAHGEHQTTQRLVAALVLVLGLAGGWAHWRRHRASWWYFAPLVFLLSVGLVYYMNFKYGYSQAPELGDAVPREVRDRDYFFLWSFSAWGVWAALGLVWLWETIAPRPRAGRVATAAGVGALALVPLVANWRAASRAGDTTAIAWARDLLNSVEPYGVLVTNGDNDTFPLWYAQEVEGVRRDVTVYLVELLNTDWYVRGLIRRPTHAYDAAAGPALWRNGAWPAPTKPVLALSTTEADSVPPYVRIARPMTFSAAGLSATVDPAQLPQDGAGSGILTRGDLLLLRMIADVWPARPVFISRSAGDMGRALGLGEHLVAQGLVRKLVRDPVPSRDLLPIASGGWFDVARTRALWDRLYRAPAAFVRKGDWVDDASLNIPLTYVLMGTELSHALASQGDTAGAAKVAGEVRTLGRALRREALVQQLLGND